MCRCPIVTPPGKLGSPSNLNPGDSQPGKKPQNVEDKPLWPIPSRLEPWKINPGTKEKQSKPRKQAQTAKRQAPLTSSLENQTNKPGKQNIKHGQKSQNLENNLSNLEYKPSNHEDDPMNLEQKSSSLKKHGNSENPKNISFQSLNPLKIRVDNKCLRQNLHFQNSYWYVLTWCIQSY